MTMHKLKIWVALAMIGLALGCRSTRSISNPRAGNRLLVDPVDQHSHAAFGSWRIERAPTFSRSTQRRLNFAVTRSAYC